MIDAPVLVLAALAGARWDLTVMKDNCICLEGRDFEFGKLFPSDGRGSYQMNQITGVRGCVQAKLVTQAAVAEAVEEAIIQIETQSSQVRKVTIACRGATHRSVGVACLLTWVFYPQAEISQNLVA